MSYSEVITVLVVVLVMLVILVIAALVVVAVAFPGRGEAVPGVPWLGTALGRVGDVLPTIADGDLDDPVDGSAEGVGASDGLTTDRLLARRVEEPRTSR